MFDLILQQGFVDKVLTSALAKVLGGLIGAGLLYLAREKIKHYFLRAFYFIRNKEVVANIKRIDKYYREPAEDLSRSIYHEVRDSSRVHVARPDANRTYLKMTSNDLPTHIKVRLDEILNSESMARFEEEPEIRGYKLVIETEPDLRFGYQELDSLEDFQQLSKDISEVVQEELFEGVNPDQSYSIAKISKGIPPGVDDVENERLHVKIHRNEDSMQMRFTDPDMLTRGVRKYFRP